MFWFVFWFVLIFGAVWFARKTLVVLRITITSFALTNRLALSLH